MGGNNRLTDRATALECCHVFEIDEAFHCQSELDAGARRAAAPGSQRAPGWWWEVERLDNQPSFATPPSASDGGFSFARRPPENEGQPK
jgi:hypothetical protein